MRQARGEQREVTSLVARLRARRTEFEAATLSRVLALSGLPEAGGPEYTAGLRAAVAGGIEYGIAGIESGESMGAPVPPPLLAQARLAAASGVGLDTVLRRYLAGHALLGDFLVEEAEGRLPPAELQRLLRRLAAIADRLLAEVSASYAEEDARRRQGAERRRAELVERLLASQPLDAAELGYELDAHHLGLLAAGPGAEKAVASLASPLDARPLVLPRPEGHVWAWLGRREAIKFEDVRRLAEASWPPRVALAVGEPGEGRAGWRLSHHQARAALPIALRGPRLVRYADVALLAATLQDDLLATSLRRLYLEPLEGERDGGETLRQTLRAYFAAERNVSSAALALGVKRHTVTNRLRTIEDQLGRPLAGCTAELEAALRLAELDEPAGPRALR